MPDLLMPNSQCYLIGEANFKVFKQIKNKIVLMKAGFYLLLAKGINVSADPDDAGKLNQRQLWFLGLMQHGQRVQPDAIVTQWSVSIRTARTDVAGLMEIGLICFVGSRKTGQYVLK